MDGERRQVFHTGAAGGSGSVPASPNGPRHGRLRPRTRPRTALTLLLDLLVIGIGIAVNPIPLTAFILVLASKGGVRKGAAFLFGWLLSLAAVIAVTAFARGDEPSDSDSTPSLAALAVKMLIGVALVLIAVRQRRRMGRPKPPKKPPKWQTGIDNMSPWYAIGLGPLVQPWGLIAAGVAIIIGAEDTMTEAQSITALVLFCLVGSSSYLAMELYAAFRPEKTQAFLTRLRAWIDGHTDQIIVVASLVLGFYLIGISIYDAVTA